MGAHAADGSSPRPTILCGLGVMLGKETGRSKVDSEDEQEAMRKRRTKGKQAGLGGYGSQRGCAFVTPTRGGGAGEIRGDHQIKGWP